MHRTFRLPSLVLFPGAAAVGSSERSAMANKKYRRRMRTGLFLGHGI